MTQTRFTSHFAILSANIIFGLGVPVAKDLLDNYITPLGFMASRCLFAAIIFWIISLFMPKEQATNKDLLIIGIGSTLGIFISQTLTALSIKMAGPIYYAVISTLVPIATLIGGALFLRERVTKTEMLSMVLGIGGAAIIATKSGAMGSGSNDFWGIIFALLSLVTWVAYLLITRTVTQRYSAVWQMKWTFTFSAIISVPAMLIYEPIQPITTSDTRWVGALELGYLVVFATVLAYFMIPYAMKMLKATTLSIYTNLQPIVATFVAILIVQDVLTWDKAIAGILVISSAMLLINAQTRKNAAYG